MALCGETAIVTSNMQGIIQSVDKGCCVMFGYEMHELPGKPLKILVPTPYKEQHDSYLDNYHKTGKAKIIGRVRTLEGQHKDGTVFPIRLSVSEVKTGVTSIYIGMIQKLQDTAAIITADMNGKIISCNQYCETIWGYTTNELIGENVRILMPNPHRDRHDTYLDNYFRTGKMKVIGKVRNVPAQHKNGIVFPVCLQVQRLRVNDIDYFRGRIERVDEEKEAVFTLDSSGIILSCNGHFVLPLLGYTDEELKGKHINLLMPKLYNDIVQENALSKRKRKFVFSPAEPKKMKLCGDNVNNNNNDNTNNNNINDGTNNPNSEIAIKTSNENNNNIDDNNIDDNNNHNHHNHNHNINNNNNNNNIDNTEVKELAHNETTNISSKKENGCANSNSRTSEKLNNFTGGCPIFHNPNAEFINFDASNHSDFSTFSHDSSEKSLEEWSLTGTKFIECIHKDGSCFTVALTISKFLTDDGSVRYAGKVKRLTNESPIREKETQNCQFSIGKYIFSTPRSIGAGSYGKVFLGNNSENTSEKVAVKILQKDIMDEVELARSRREIEIMAQLKHPNICRLYDSFETTDRLYMIMEYCANGELFSYVNERDPLTEKEAKKFFVQILSGIHYCHNKNVIHRDIKNKNILLDGNNNIKIIDFGLSNFTIEGGYRNTFCGTPAYSAPEMILAQQYVGPEVDVWSMGVVLFSMLTKEFPFRTVSDIISGAFKIPSTLSANCADAIRRMLTVDPATRITVQSLLEHPFITEESQSLPVTLEIKQIQCVVLPDP